MSFVWSAGLAVVFIFICAFLAHFRVKRRRPITNAISKENKDLTLNLLSEEED